MSSKKSSGSDIESTRKGPLNMSMNSTTTYVTNSETNYLNLKEPLRSMDTARNVSRRQEEPSSSSSLSPPPSSPPPSPQSPKKHVNMSMNFPPPSHPPLIRYSSIDAIAPKGSDSRLDTDDSIGGASASSNEDVEEKSSMDREIRRLEVLKSFLFVLDGESGAAFDRLTNLASRLFRTPMAQVTLADLDKQYRISSRGLELVPNRKSAFCSHAVHSESDLLLVPDATKDSRFATDPQVSGSPGIRFYAGAPLVCSEGYSLGTLSVTDTVPRLEPLTLDDKQSLMELAAMAMETLVDLRTKKVSALRDPAQQIACTAHDLLTPLTGIALSLSLLREDEGLQKKLSDQQRDMIETAANCSTVMNSICQKTMEVFRDQGRPAATTTATQPKPAASAKKIGPVIVKVADLVKNLNTVMEPFPKQVPLIISVDPSVPSEFVSDDMKIFRSATNFLTNACAKTESGSIRLKIFAQLNDEKEQELVFECEDSGPGIDVAKYPYLFKPVADVADPLNVTSTSTIVREVPKGACRAAMQNTGLGLYSVATQISSIGGAYGFHPRGAPADWTQQSGNIGKQQTGSVFWFRIPLVVPQRSSSTTAASNKKVMIDGIKTLGRHASSNGLANIDDSASSRSRLLGSSKNSGVIFGSSSSLSSTKTDVNRKRTSPHNAPQRQHRALVIEDSLVVRKSIARALSRLGFEVKQAVNGMEGLKELQNSLFDLVLCDFLMPVLDGLDCVQQYREWEQVNRPRFRHFIVGISAHASEKDVKQGYKVGMDGFRQKPVTYKNLVDLTKGREFNMASKKLDDLGHENAITKRRKTEDIEHIIDDKGHRVCLVVENSTVISKLAEMATESKGWRIVSVNDNESALRLLKQRNWDAVLLDDELVEGRYLAAFREWEKDHRVNRQKNVILMSANFIAPSQGVSSSFQVPTGYDGALSKPIQMKSLQSFLTKAGAQSACFSRDIVTR